MTFHIFPQCGMTSPYHGENPGAVSILHEYDKREMNDLAKGVGSDGSELRSVDHIE